MSKTVNQVRGSFRNIGAEYESSTEEERCSGINFYPLAYIEAERIGHIANKGIEVGAGIIAVLSPQTDWKLNLSMAYDFLENRFSRRQTVANNVKAYRILLGANPLDVIGMTAHKTRAFYNAIVNPLGTMKKIPRERFWNVSNIHCVIDRHAGGVYYGKPLQEFQRSQLSYWRVYNRISNAYIQKAYELDIHPNELQAITWHSFRHKYKGRPAKVVQRELNKRKRIESPVNNKDILYTPVNTFNIEVNGGGVLVNV